MTTFGSVAPQGFYLSPLRGITRVAISGLWTAPPDPDRIGTSALAVRLPHQAVMEATMEYGLLFAPG